MVRRFSQANPKARARMTLPRSATGSRTRVGHTGPSGSRTSRSTARSMTTVTMPRRWPSTTHATASRCWRAATSPASAESINELNAAIGTWGRESRLPLQFFSCATNSTWQPWAFVSSGSGRANFSGGLRQARRSRSPIVVGLSPCWLRCRNQDPWSGCGQLETLFRPPPR
jgi:hypothetical protein